MVYFFTAFSMVFLAEMGDKTQLFLVGLSSKFKLKSIIAGVAAAILVLNAAAYTHTSVAILDAIKAVRVRTAEVHLTEPKEREDFRRVSFVGMAAERTFSGRGFESYADAIRYFAQKS